MINYLEGLLKEKRPTSCTIDVNGVGYEVNIPLSTFEKLAEPGAKVKIFTFLHIRENLWELYGFAAPKEKELFCLLNSISGVGPRLALAVLSSLSLEILLKIVEKENVSALTSVPGVGRKIAQRLIFELHQRGKKLYTLIEEKDKFKKPGEGKDYLEEDAVQALVSLGYKRMFAEKALESLRHKSIKSLEVLIREMLKRI